MKLRRALRLYAGLDATPLSYNEARAATERLDRLIKHRGWNPAALRYLIEREANR